MQTTPIRYIGPRSDYTDPAYGSGDWKKGQVKDIPIDTACQLIRHDDVWMDARSKVKRAAAPLVPATVLPAYLRRPQDELPPAVPLQHMNRMAMERYALLHFGERFEADTPDAQVQRRVMQLAASV